jgi:hypothetical protein
MDVPELGYARSGDLYIAYQAHELKGAPGEWRLFAVTGDVA